MLKAAVTTQVTMKTPDGHGSGFTQTALDPLRYGGQVEQAWETTGILRSFMPSGVRVLDVGCGLGGVTNIINREKNNEVCGIEPDAIRAEAARKAGIDVTCGFLTAAYFEEHGSFDVIMFTDVLEHVPDPAALLDLALTGLRPKGRLLISVPNVAHWTMRWYLFTGRFDYTETGIRDATHLRWFTRKTLEAMLHSRGLEVERIQHSAGTFLTEYYRMPWKAVPRTLRFGFIKRMARLTPLLFGCQHLVMAKRKGEE